MADSNTEHLQEVLKIHNRRLQLLRLQSAQFGIYTPAHLQLEIEDLEKQINDIQAQLTTVSLPKGPARDDSGAFSSAQLNQLVNLLSAVPSLANQDVRNEIVRNLPTRIANSIVRSTQNKLDILNITRTALNYDGGLEALIEQIRFFEEESRQMQAVDTFLATKA